MLGTASYERCIRMNSIELNPHIILPKKNTTEFYIDIKDVIPCYVFLASDAAKAISGQHFSLYYHWESQTTETLTAQNIQHQVDQTIEDSFPASDPPSWNP